MEEFVVLITFQYPFEGFEALYHKKLASVHLRLDIEKV